MHKEEDFDFTTLSDRIYLSGQCWKNRTEILGERNNLSDFTNFLYKKFNKNFTMIRFGYKETEPLFINQMVFRLPDFDITYAFNISRIIKGWLGLDSNYVCVIELRGNLNKFLFLISCILKINNVNNSCKECLEIIMKHKYRSKKDRNATLMRYVEYVDKIFASNESISSRPYRLKQIILAKTDRITKDSGLTCFKFLEEGVNVNNETAKVLIDENYVIAEFKDLFLKGNVKIEVFHQTVLGNHPIFELYINTCFMDEGLYRYGFDDIITPLGNHLTSKKLIDQFFADVVLIGSELKERRTYSIDVSYHLCLRLLSQALNKKVNEFEFHKLISDGYNKLYSKIFLQLGFSKDETVAKINAINIRDLGLTQVSRNMKNSIASKIIFKTQEDHEKGIDRSLEQKLTMEVKPFVSREYMEVGGNENILIEDIEILPEKVLFNTKTQASAFKPFFKLKEKKNSSETKEEDQKTLVAKRPLHLQVINNTVHTIYNELGNQRICFDKAKFEEWFCEPIAKEIVKNISKKKNIINDEQRLFLVSISLKTLQKRDIDANKLESILNTHPFLYKYEELQNMLRVLPKENEIEKLNEACLKIETSKLKSELNEIEYFFYLNRNCANLKKILNILMFERRSFDDLDDIENLIDRIKRVYYKIIESNNFRLLLKTIIDFSNMVNYRYSVSKFKRKTKGFKFLSLKNVLSYKGIRDENRLMTFISLTLLKEKPDIFNIFSEFHDVKAIHKEDLLAIKERINRMVFEYTDSKHCYGTLDSSSLVKEQLGRFMSFACKKIKGVKDKYKEVIYISAIIKRKLGEDDSANINEILKTLDDFLNVLEYEYKMQQT